MRTPLIDAVIFDLDGVITRTADVHSAAWKNMFDDYLESRETNYGEPFREFTHEEDYLQYVDGKPRYKGVESFLESRNISLPLGDPGDDPSEESICGLGNRKNKAFNTVLKKEGVSVFDSTLKLIKELKNKGIRVGVASSSKNCKAVLMAAGILDLFETRVDGVVSVDMGLKGKPEPDIFLTACRNLHCKPHKSVVVEDAVSGVQAGMRGNFGLVLGIARENNKQQLLGNGADIVVNDLEEIDIPSIETWFDKGLDSEGWKTSYHDFDPGKESTREALLTTGNGYMGTRGSMDEFDASDINYPGTYIAGLYNRLESEVGNRTITNEDFVNTVNWTKVSFAIEDDEDWMDLDNIIEIHRSLDMKTGEYCRKMVVSDKAGRETAIRSTRFISMHNRHIAAQRYTLMPLNYSGNIRIKAGINGEMENMGVERYKELESMHLDQVTQGNHDGYSYVVTRTNESGIDIATAQKTAITKSSGNDILKPKKNLCPGKSIHEFSLDVVQGEEVILEKVVTIVTSGDYDKPALEAASEIISSSSDYNTLFEENKKAWEEIWSEIDIRVQGDRLSQKLIRLHLFHMMASASPHNKDIDAGLTARGLHGEAYRGHVFWDELFIMPFYSIHFPETAKSLLMYRYNRLGKAREYAAKHGFTGAMFPWQSGSNGREETQVVHLNPVSGKWGRDHSSLQRHVSLAIAYNTWYYYHITKDDEFMKKAGLELFWEIGRFWTGMAKYNEESGRYDIDGVMGPDEFHEKYPGSKKGGIRNNAYTNLMVSWMLKKAIEFAKEFRDSEMLNPNVPKPEEEELNLWNKILTGLEININKEGILEQYDGYFDLKELDWEHYRSSYGDIHRMDRILKSEGKSPDAFKVAKQADTLMLFYNLDTSTVTALLKAMGYYPVEGYVRKNLEYYLQRTSHGSTLSRVVHAKLADMTGDHSQGWKLFSEALASDYNDIQGGTTGEGIHLGVMAGTIMIAYNTFAGIDMRKDVPEINPHLPHAWESLSFSLRGKGYVIDLKVSPGEVFIYAGKITNEALQLKICGNNYTLTEGECLSVECNR